MNKVQITDDQVAAFEALGYEIVREIYVVMPEAPEAEEKPSRRVVSKYAGLTFHPLPPETLQGMSPQEQTSYQGVARLFRAADKSMMRRDCIVERLHNQTFPGLRVQSVSSYVSKLQSVDVLRVKVANMLPGAEESDDE